MMGRMVLIGSIAMLVAAPLAIVSSVGRDDDASKRRDGIVVVSSVSRSGLARRIDPVRVAPVRTVDPLDGIVVLETATGDDGGNASALVRDVSGAILRVAVGARVGGAALLTAVSDADATFSIEQAAITLPVSEAAIDADGRQQTPSGDGYRVPANFTPGIARARS